MKCENKASYRFTWPGRDGSFICSHHVYTLRNISDALGLPLQIIPLTNEELEEGTLCNQK